MPEIPKAYEPGAVEERWYRFWLDEKCFVADAHSAKPAYSIVIPPPNVTGVLTLGHVLNNTIQDILARKARMDGKEVLWLPGTDHAGIATQTAVEKALKKSGEIRHREDLGREKFLTRIWEWKEKHGGIILQQLRALGASCDWSRTRFTMDADYSRCVLRVFVDLYTKGLIYRGKRMVNWCPASLTALSDEEVIMKEQKGLLYYFKVEMAGEPGKFLTIATTRPETIPGDTGVAVNPKDGRFAHLIGRHVLRPLPAELPAEQRRIPIIGDEHVDFEFGTGVLKVTPAHDKADFEIGLRHGLAAVEVIGPDGIMTDAAGADLRGLDRFKARKVAVEKLTALGAMEKEEPHTNNVGYSERADVPVEPRLSEQWFLKYPSTAEARGCVAQGADATGKKMQFYPERWARVYDHWMEGLQDWCISRQLWWGHRIPVWSKKASEVEGGWVEGITGEKGAERSVSGIEGATSFLRLRGELVEAATQSDEEARALEARGFRQDPDVLDTWFSSWLWPFATMGWPAKTETLEKFYPTTDLVTGPDIIFFWVARMIMAGYEYMGEMPFRNVYFTGIIRDKQGRKMSKSLGNSPDPLDLIQKFGADALRFGIIRSAPQGQDLLFDEQQVELGRNFCNKVWNACRFRQMAAAGSGGAEGEIDRALLTIDDKWILLRLDRAIREVTDALGGYRFNEAAQVLYRFFWNEFCDWYLEASKASLGESAAPNLRANTLAVIDFVLSHTLRLFHPFLPFITEELWHGLGFHDDLPTDQGGRTIMYARWPKPLDAEFKKHYGIDESDERVAEARYELVRQGRNLLRENGIAANRKVKFILKPAGGFGAGEAEVLKILLHAESVEVALDFVPGKNVSSAHSPLGELYLPLEGLRDEGAERARLEKELLKHDEEIRKVEAKLANPNFTGKVPPAVLEEHQNRLREWQSKRQQVKAALDALG